MSLSLQNSTKYNPFYLLSQSGPHHTRLQLGKSAVYRVDGNDLTKDNDF